LNTELRDNDNISVVDLNIDFHVYSLPLLNMCRAVSERYDRSACGNVISPGALIYHNGFARAYSSDHLEYFDRYTVFILRARSADQSVAMGWSLPHLLINNN